MDCLIIETRGGNTTTTRRKEAVKPKVCIKFEIIQQYRVNYSTQTAVTSRQPPKAIF